MATTGPLTPIANLKGRTDDQGNLTVNVIAGGGAGGTSSTFGAAMPATGTAAGFQDGSGNMAAGLLDGSGYLKVNVAAGGAGGGAVTVADGADVAQGTTTDAAALDATGTVNAHVRGFAKILADVWDSVNHWLKVSIQGTAAVTQSGTWTVNPKATLSPATQNITVQDTGSSVAAGANSQSLITGSPTAASTAAFALSAVETLRVMFSGTWTGTLQLEVSFDGGVTYLVNGAHQTGTAYTISSAMANCAASVNVAGATHFRVRATAAMTGTAVVTVTESVASAVVYLGNALRVCDPTTPTQQVAVSAAGAAKVDGSAVTQPVNVAQVGGTNSVTGGVNGTLAVGGNVATNVAIGTNPVNLGAQAVSAENTAVTATRMAQLVTDLVGKLIVLPYANPENFVSGAITSAMTGTTTTSLLGAPASGLRNYITQITVSNSHATVGTDVIIQDGSGGTTLYTIPAAAVYGGAVITFPTPLRQPTTATAIFCANVMTGASTKVSASGYKGI